MHGPATEPEARGAGETGGVRRARLLLAAPRATPELKEWVAEASHALARLDGARLGEMALSCEALNRELGGMDAGARADLARQAKEAAADMAVFARVLEATRANRNVMSRLRELRAVQLEYSERQARAGAGSASSAADGGRWRGSAEGGHGND